MAYELCKYGGNETLLIVDDDKHVLNLLSDFFRENGYNVITARDGDEAVKEYINNCDHIHLVLMDIVMPRKDGIAASEEIFEHNPDAVIYFMSGYSSDLDIEIIGKNFIKKPFLPSNVIKTVRKCLDDISSADGTFKMA
jgi:DNA-binding NtrC family response regulator